MSEMIGRLRIALGLETAAFEKGAKRSKAEIDALGSTAEKVGFKIGSMGKAVAIGAAAFAGGAVASQLRDLVSAGLEHASALGEQAAQLGVTARTLQEYRYAASQAGLSNDEMDQALARLTRTVGEAAAGGKAQVGVFEKLGVAFRDTTGNARDAGDLLPEIAEALKGVHSPAERAAILVDLFGKSGQKLEPMLAGGADGVNDLRVAAEKLGLVLSDEQIQKADDTADKLGAMNQVLSARVAGVVANNADAILRLADALMQAASASVQFADKYSVALTAAGGAAVGARFGGLPGGAIGAAVGWMAGAVAKDKLDDSNMDLRFRTQKLREATASYRRQRRFSSQSYARGSYAYQQLLKEQRLMESAMRSGGASLAARSASVGGDVVTLDSLADPKKGNGKGGGGRSSGKSNAAEVERTAEAMRKLSVWGDDAAKSMGAANDNLATFADRVGPALDRVPPAFDAARLRAGEFADQLATLQSRLFPEVDAMARYKSELDLITLALERHKISAEQAAEWRHRLAMEGRSTASAIDAILPDKQIDPERIQASVDVVSSSLEGLKGKASTVTVQVAKSFKDMADETISALQGMANAVQSGDFIDILSSVLNLGLQLGSIGAFGKTVQTNINSMPKRAWGGPVNAGQMYMVGERGPEMFVSGSPGQIIPNHRLGGGSSGGGIAQIVPSPYFDVVVDGRIMRAAPAIAGAGGQLGYNKVVRAGSRRLG